MPRVGIVLGSTSDEEKAKAAAVMLEKFGVDYELEVLSAHRSPLRVAEYAVSAAERPAAAMITWRPRSSALSAYSLTLLGLRCALITSSS